MFPASCARLLRLFVVASAARLSLGRGTPAWLPPLLTFSNGSAVRDVAAWEERKVEVARLLLT